MRGHPSLSLEIYVTRIVINDDIIHLGGMTTYEAPATALTTTTATTAAMLIDWLSSPAVP